MGAALAAELRDPIRAADELRFFIRREDLGGVLAIYMPPDARARRPFLLLDKTVTGWARQRFVTLAVGHHMLRHRSLDLYAYDADGPRFDSPLEANEARYFADVFLANLPAMPVRPSRAPLEVLRRSR